MAAPHYVELARLLRAADPAVEINLVGGPGESAINRELAASDAGFVDAGTDGSVQSLAALMAACDRVSHAGQPWLSRRVVPRSEFRRSASWGPRRRGNSTGTGGTLSSTRTCRASPATAGSAHTAGRAWTC
jgi:hypothetical protein